MKQTMVCLSYLRHVRMHQVLKLSITDWKMNAKSLSSNQNWQAILWGNYETLVGVLFYYLSQSGYGLQNIVYAL